VAQSTLTDAKPRRAEFAGQLKRVSDRAADAVGGFEDRYFRLADLSLRLRFAGALTGPLTLGLAHREVEATADPDLTVRIWDSRSTGTPAPRPPWSGDAYLEHGIIKDHFGPGFYAVFPPGTGVLNVLDEERREGYFWMDDAHRLGLWEIGAPLRTLIHLWLAGRGHQLVHAAAVGRPEGCVLLVGGSGAGKSSSALVCLWSSLQLLGEDYCVVSPGSPQVVSSLYCTAKVGPEALARLPQLRGLVHSPPTPDSEKALLDLYASVPEKLLPESPLRAVAIPRIVNREDSSIRPASRGAALAAVAPSTLLQLPGTGSRAMTMLREIVTGVGSHILEVGSDPDGIPPAIEDLLGR
jgi:hypothetical protein